MYQGFLFDKGSSHDSYSVKNHVYYDRPSNITFS
jgi:hypothetical protein